VVNIHRYEMRKLLYCLDLHLFYLKVFFASNVDIILSLDLAIATSFDYDELHAGLVVLNLGYQRIEVIRPY